MRRPLALLCLVLVSVAAVSAQHQPAGSAVPAFRTSTNLVTIDAVVTANDGTPVTDLTRDDFVLTVDGYHQRVEQAMYIRTADQPRVLAAVRASARPGDVVDATRPRSAAAQILNTARTTRDTVARTIALVVDDLGLSFESTYYVRRALHKYIDTQIEPGDLVAIVRTAGGVGALQQFTTDKRLLHAAAERVKWDFRSRQAIGAFEDVAQTRPGNSGFDDIDALRTGFASMGSMAALEYIAGGVSQLPGRKCIVYFSEGFQSIFDDRMGAGYGRASGSERIWKAMTRMLARVNAAGVVIYTIDARGLQTGGSTAADDSPGFGEYSGGLATTYAGPSTNAGTAPGRSSGPSTDAGTAPGDSDSSALQSRGSGKRRRGIADGQESLRFIADQTGGFVIENNNDLNLGIRRILTDQQGYYLLGYTAASTAVRAGWDQDRIKVRVRRKGAHVRARQGYFGPLDAREQRAAPADPLVMAALSPFSAGDITVRLTSAFAYDEKTGPYVRSLVFIDPSDLRFDVDQAGKHTARFQVLLMTIGDNGQTLDGWRREVPLTLSDQTFRLVKERGIVVTVRTTAKETGPYQMRASVVDLSSKALGSASQYLEVPKIGRGQLALSGVLLKGLRGPGTRADESDINPDAPEGLGAVVLFEPEVRVLSPGVQAVFAYEIYNGLKGQSGLQMGTALLRDGKVVYESPFTDVTAGSTPGDTLRAIPIAGTLALGEDMPAGTYTLQVTVRGKNGKRLERKQWLDFEIRR